MIKSIKFKTYKSYKDWQVLNLKPITILIGKNSSGKSAIAKLPTLFEESLKGSYKEAIQLNNNGIELGAEFRDLVYGKREGEVLEFIVQNDDKKLAIKIVGEIGSENNSKIINWQFNEELNLHYNDINKTYSNKVDGKEYVCEFRGMSLHSISEKGSRHPISIPDISDLMIKTSYFGPFRETPQRSYTVSQFNNADQFGIKGQNAYLYLIKDYQTHEKSLLKNVSDWYKSNFDGWGVEVQKDIQQPNYSIELTKENPSININITNVGQGMSQVLPLVVRAFLKAENPTTIIIEQPELHLHPGAHGNLAELFVDSLKDENKRYIIETHSQNFILRVRRLIAEGKFNKEKLALYWTDFDEEKNVSNLSQIEVDDLGRVKNWPEFIFRDTLDEASELRSAQMQKTEK